MNIGTSFHGIKAMGDLGTFSGYTSYNYQNRRNYYRTIKMEPYNGEAFNISDTTSSNFRYMGPKVVLMYSWEPVYKLYVGGSVSYELLDGLKEKFSYAKTIFRDAEIKAGIAYVFSDNLIVGANLQYSNSQESIEASDVNLLDVELRNYRGDNFFILKRGQSVTSKIQKQGLTIGSQLYWDDREKFSFGFQANYTPSNSRILKPYQNFDEVEDCYAAFESFDIQFKTHYKFNDKLLFGAYAGYFYDYSWSKISLKELLIWEWDTKKTVLGIGTTYKVSPDLLIGMEYEFSNNMADSSKYIDKVFLNLKSIDHTIRAGAEYKIEDQYYLRAGLNYGIMQHDLYYGGNDCKIYKITGGIGFPVLNNITVNADLRYVSLSPGTPLNFSRNYFEGNISIELKTF
jgi:opacity protein-like surface antigen